MADQQRYFIALLPSHEIQVSATEIKEYFRQHYHSKASLNSPPHVTLYPPFLWGQEKLSLLKNKLSDFASLQCPVELRFDRYNAFKPRVIYWNVIPTPELMALRKELFYFLETELNLVNTVEKSRPFHPHLTVAFRDLTQTNFHLAWQEFEHQKIGLNCLVNHLTLLIHNGKTWEICQEFTLTNS